MSTSWVICPLRNSLHLTRKALPTFLAQDIGDVRVLFIDNCSSDGTHEWLTSLDGRVYKIYTNRPRSVAESWNYGLQWCFREGADYALVVNNDVELRPDTYRRLVEDSGLFVTAVGNADPSCVLPPWDAPIAAPRPRPDYSCFLIRKECWELVPFDESYQGAFFEDNCHHVRMHRAGIQARCIDIPFYHVGSGTVKSASDEDRKRIAGHYDENKQRFYREFGCYPGTPEYEALFTDRAGE